MQLEIADIKPKEKVPDIAKKIEMNLLSKFTKNMSGSSVKFGDFEDLREDKNDDD